MFGTLLATPAVDCQSFAKWRVAQNTSRALCDRLWSSGANPLSNRIRSRLNNMFQVARRSNGLSPLCHSRSECLLVGLLSP